MTMAPNRKIWNILILYVLVNKDNTLLYTTSINFLTWQFRVVFFEDSESADDTENSELLVDVGEDEDYYYYYDFNNDDTLNVEDFPDYEDYLNGVGTRNKIRGKCIRVLKNETKGKDWKRKIGPLWRSLAQQIGVRRCRTNDKIQELNVVNDAIRFGA